MQKTPKGFRMHIGIFGRRNVGKSSLLNALTRQAVSIVSPEAGTTTDPVEKPMELLPIGPVLFIDTAGVDDIGALGEERARRTRLVFDRTDLAVIVARADEWGEFEESLVAEMKERNVATVVVFNKADLSEPDDALLNTLMEGNVPCVQTVASESRGIDELRETLVLATPEEHLNAQAIVGDLIEPGAMIVFVIPIDKEAPRGRLILPQVQSIRDTLDHDAICMVVKETDLARALSGLKRPPALVVTDSQAFASVMQDTPDDVPVTGFSVLFARLKGDINEFARGAAAINHLKPGDRVLVAESCTHHPIEDDIGRVKIPKWLNARVGGELDFTTTQGHDFPEDLSDYKLVIQCGACMHNRREVLTRVFRCRRAGVPITNYGVAIATALGVIDRALGPFPEALRIYREELSQ